MIWSNPRMLYLHLWSNYPDKKIILTSGGFDCVHVGHIRLLQESRRGGDCLVVVVNGDGFLVRKKGYVFMPHRERMEIIDAMRGVDYVIGWDDGTQYIDGAIRILRPHYYTKGGDRSSPDAIAACELAACKEVGCEIFYGVGGASKVQSSSRLVEATRTR